MPRGDGTGPIARKGNREGVSAGVEGFCVCPNCGTKVKHQRGVPCNSVKCPQCGKIMTRGV